MTRGWLQLVFVVACKVGITGALVLGPLYAEELFPGNVRSAASQACSLVRLALLAPWELDQISVLGAMPLVVDMRNCCRRSAGIEDVIAVCRLGGLAQLARLGLYCWALRQEQPSSRTSCLEA